MYLSSIEMSQLSTDDDSFDCEGNKGCVKCKKPSLDSEKKQKKRGQEMAGVGQKDQYDLFLANIFFESAVMQ